MKIGVAQIQSRAGDIAANILRHIEFIRQAAAQGANALFFPELSLSNYECRLAPELAMQEDDARLNVFEKLSDELHMTIGVGLPTLSPEGVRISMAIFQPHMSRQIYSKQWLHEDELPFFVPGNQPAIIPLDGLKLAPAICYESLLPEHVRQAHQLGATLYVASVAKHKAGIEKAMRYFPELARHYAMPVALSNCLGPCEGFTACGNSTIWNAKGQLMDQLDSKQEGILLLEITPDAHK
jgi:predicted amidohydrolase